MEFTKIWSPYYWYYPCYPDSDQLSGSPNLVTFGMIPYNHWSIQCWGLHGFVVTSGPQHFSAIYLVTISVSRIRIQSIWRLGKEFVELLLLLLLLLQLMLNSRIGMALTNRAHTTGARSIQSLSTSCSCRCCWRSVDQQVLHWGRSRESFAHR